jgi:hypothetical protein
MQCIGIQPASWSLLQPLVLGPNLKEKGREQLLREVRFLVFVEHRGQSAVRKIAY